MGDKKVIWITGASSGIGKALTIKTIKIINITNANNILCSTKKTILQVVLKTKWMK